MLAIRMQRTGRKGHSQYRVIVQDSRRTPSSGRLVYNLGSYNPHTKEAILNKEKVAFYLSNGAQPSERVSTLLRKEGVKLPEWVKDASKKEFTTRNPEKLRKNQPKEEVVVVEETVEVVETTEEAPVVESTTESTEEK